MLAGDGCHSHPEHAIDRIWPETIMFASEFRGAQHNLTLCKSIRAAIDREVGCKSSVEGNGALD